jgi:hypothetical protein
MHGEDDHGQCLERRVRTDFRQDLETADIAGKLDIEHHDIREGKFLQGGDETGRVGGLARLVSRFSSDDIEDETRGSVVLDH